MKEYAARYYKSRDWQACRLAYMKKVGGLCEICLKNGRIVPGVIVHHKVHITPDNIECPEITMNFDNLELVCRDCHAAEHNEKFAKRRFTVDAAGHVSPLGA